MKLLNLTLTLLPTLPSALALKPDIPALHKALQAAITTSRDCKSALIKYNATSPEVNLVHCVGLDTITMPYLEKTLNATVAPATEGLESLAELQDDIGRLLAALPDRWTLKNKEEELLPWACRTLKNHADWGTTTARALTALSVGLKKGGVLDTFANMLEADGKAITELIEIVKEKCAKLTDASKKVEL